ncbi:MAG TPA: hypothetical protein VHR72_13945 [Gemmataceae bacterium]|jgi:hypothetical protein|nr:hypothetical protein [Gemmataceae bacterium]
MARVPRIVCCLLLLAALDLGCASVDTPQLTPLVSTNTQYAADRNPVYIPLSDYGRVYENCLRVLGDYGFRFAESNRYDGRIETMPRSAAGLLLPLRPGSPDLYERTLATLQSYRHRVTLLILPADQGGFFIQVIVRKELEDLPKPEHSIVGPAAFRTDQNVDQTTEVIDDSSFDSAWISKGQDPAMEQEIIRRLKLLM